MFLRTGHLMTKIVTAGLVLLGVVTSCQTMSSGAPLHACKTILPVHGARPMTTDPPFIIQVYTDLIYSSQNVSVSILIKPGSKVKSFKGFIIMAKLSPYAELTNEKAVGSFDKQGDSHTINCFDTLDTAVTHIRFQSYKRFDIVWFPPRHYRGEIRFVATVVKDFKHFWRMLLSDPVTVKH